jgi:hypothetical protein
MEFTLVNGRFTALETEQLLSQLVKVKTDFHLSKIDTINHSEEDIMHSEKRIKELEDSLRKIKDAIRGGGYSNVALRARMVIEFCPDYHNV